MKYFLFRRCTIEQLFMGLFCKNEQVRSKSYEALKQIEKLPLGGAILKKANVYCLYVLQNKQI